MIHKFFEVGLLIKTLDSIAEVILGILFYILSPLAVNNLINAVLGNELMEQPRDWLFNAFFHGWHGLPPETQYLWAFIFLSHGLVKLFLVIGLYKEKLWVFPIAGVAFGLFAVYQIYHILLVFSTILVTLTILDFIFIYLIVGEYRFQKQLRSAR